MFVFTSSTSTVIFSFIFRLFFYSSFVLKLIILFMLSFVCISIDTLCFLEQGTYEPIHFCFENEKQERNTMSTTTDLFLNDENKYVGY